MPFRPVFREPELDRIPACPLCKGHMEPVYDRSHQKVLVCTDCHTGVTIPAAAWEVARLKRDTEKVRRPTTERRKTVRPPSPSARAGNA